MGQSQPKELVAKQIYPTELHDKLLLASKVVYDVAPENFDKTTGKVTGKILVLFKDDNYGFLWVLDLTKFKHPFGLGPSERHLCGRKGKCLDITEEFNRQAHSS